MYSTHYCCYSTVRVGGVAQNSILTVALSFHSSHGMTACWACFHTQRFYNNIHSVMLGSSDTTLPHCTCPSCADKYTYHTCGCCKSCLVFQSVCLKSRQAFCVSSLGSLFVSNVCTEKCHPPSGQQQASTCETKAAGNVKAQDSKAAATPPDRARWAQPGEFVQQAVVACWLQQAVVAC